MARTMRGTSVLGGFVLSCFVAAGAWAGSFQVNPIRLDLSPKSTTAALTVKNTGDDAVVVQVSIDAWSQEEGKDVYVPTREVLVTPPILTIPPGAERIVRAGLRRPADDSRELSYRLFLQEVPPPPKPGFQGLVVALRVGLPVFVQPKTGTAAPKVAWQARRLPENRLEVRVSNEGNAHLQIAEVNLFSQGADPVGTQAGLTYVLPDKTRTWTIPLAQSLANSRIRLKAVTDAGNLEAEVDVTD